MSCNLAPDGACPALSDGQSARAMWSPAATQRSRECFNKTILCRYFSRTGGRCDRGAQCQFAHGKGELRSKPDLWKTAVCRLWSQGRCPNNSRDCTWAHGTRELRPVPADQGEWRTTCSSAATDEEGSQGDPESVHCRSDDRDVGFGALVLVGPRRGSPGNVLLVQADGLDARSRFQKRCNRCQRACALPAAGGFCSRCGLALQESCAIAVAAARQERCQSDGSDAYDSDDDAFFERRDAAYGARWR